MNGPLAPLMVVTDRHATRGRPLAAVVAAALRGGARLFQLREKDLAPEELATLAREILGLTRGHGAALLVNGAVDVAREIGADGVVLPARSIATAEARARLGPGFRIGRSTHAADEVRLARDEGADFALFGPVFETPSKAAFGPPQGLGRLREASEAGLPVYAIGGIDARTAGQALTAGAAGVAVIREVMSAADPEASTGRLLRAMERDA